MSTFFSKRDPVCLPPDPFLTLPAFIFQRPRFMPSSIAFFDAQSDHSLTFGDLRARVYAFANGLHRFGVLPGDVVFVLSPNSIPFVVAMLGIMSIGAVFTTTNPVNRPDEIAKQMIDSGAKFVATLPELLESVIDKVRQLKLPLILIGEGITMPAGVSSCITFSDLLQIDPIGKLPSMNRTRQEDTAALLYSSGTTGTSKGVIITHKNLIAQTLLLLYSEEGLPWTSRTYMCLIPMFHVYGLAFFGSGLPARGCTTVLLPRFDMIDTLAAVQKYRVTHMPLVPPILIALAKLRVVENYDLSSLVGVGSGAAPLSKEVIAAFRARFPNVIIAQGYGLTESTAVGAHTASEDETKHYGSAGLLAANTEARIVDPDSGKPLFPNMKGEIWLRGPTIMKGYFGRPGETAATIDKEGWLHTGDLGYIDAEGYLFVVDRLKELIKYKGLQVAPAELEAVLLSHSEIVDAAVIPYPDDEAGQIPMAYVVRGPGSSLTEADVKEFVAAQVAPYKKIRKVAFVKSIPKSASGKILRRQLVTEATSKL